MPCSRSIRARPLPMTEKTEQTSATEALKRALAAKKAGTQSGPMGGKGGCKDAERAMQREAAAKNKPAFKLMSKRG
jgi:hypothetical protein